jgi:Cd2+/Zn2+-exporting ATPase
LILVIKTERIEQPIITLKMDTSCKSDCDCCEHSHKHDHEHGGSHAHSHEHSHGNQWTLPAVSAIMLVAGIIFENFSSILSTQIYSLVYYFIAFLPVGVPVFKDAYSEIKSGEYFSEFTLMAIAAIGAFCIGEYPEAVAVMLFYTVGETLQHEAVDRASRNISNLLDVRPERTAVIRNNVLTEVSPQDVEVGELIELKPGERVPLDGELVNDDASFDTSALTGESVPRTIRKGEQVLAGMIVSDRSIRVKVSRPYNQSTLARILSLVKDAAERKAPTELFIRKFARIYTPIVIGLAAAIVIVPALVAQVSTFDYNFADWLYRGLVFLVISCPCALVVSVPLGYFAGIGAASKLGILFKGSNYLDAITRVDAIAFDKTGTLTKGKFEVFQLDIAATTDKSLLLNAVASVEAKSTHPIAQAVVAYATENNAQQLVVTEMNEIPGHGVAAVVDGHHVLVGNLRLMAKYGVAVPQSSNDSIATIVVCAINNVYAGALYLADTLKDDAVEAIVDLKREGVGEVHLLSGDKREIVEHFANRLGIQYAEAELLPEDKASYITHLMRDKHKSVAFVGDGMNDAPVLAMSSVGIAMGGLGSDAAIESADVVIQNDMPSRVATAVRIGKYTSTVVRQNIAGAIGVKIVILIAGALGFASLWSAVFADVGVALLAVGNSMRALYHHYH